MRPPLSPRTLLFFTSYSSPLLVKISHFSSSLHAFHSVHPGRRHDEESRNVRVLVWWDFENCNLPNGANGFKVSHSITAAVRANGIKGPVTITAFGDVSQLSRTNQEALSSTGINITHIPYGGKNSADRSLLVDLMYWVSQNPPPAHLFLISGDRDFASILHRLRMNNYNILLASRKSTGVLCSAASIVWHWPSLIRGETLAGKHFNQPPDGPYGSWYGHSKVPLEDPFSVTEQPASRVEDLLEPSPDSKPCPVPKIIPKLISCILKNHPEGISITELRSKLGNTLNIDTNFYGYKKFSHFLLSMPHILKLQSEGDGQFVVHGITSKTPEPFQSNPTLFAEPASNNGVQDFSATLKSNGKLGSVAGGVNGKLSLSLSPEPNVKGPPKRIQEPSAVGRSVTGVMDKKSAVPSSPELNVEEVQQHSPHEKGVEQVKNRHLPPVVEQDSASAVGFLKRVWRTFFGRIDGGPMNKSQSIPEKCSTSDVMSEKKGHETAEFASTVNGSKMAEVGDKCVNSTSLDAKPICQVPYSSANNRPAIDSKTATVSEAYGNDSSTGPGFFNQMVYWCKFWRSNPNSDILNDQPRDKLDQINNISEKHSLFSMDSFWSDMESFLGTVNASVIVSQSRTREQMAQNLRKEGPPALRSLSESDVLHLVDLLISEKKWMQEGPSQTSSFKLTWPVGKSSSVQARGSNGLSSIFLGTTLQSPEHGERKYQNIPHAGVSPPAIHNKPSVRSRSDILADCQKLVSEILKNYPNGFNMGSFRKCFLERHGYPLDLQKLGHQKLVSLLETMPGVKIISTYIFPSSEASSSSGLEIALPGSQENSASRSVANSDGELSDSTKNNDDLESPWEELGPVADTSSTKNEMESVSRRKTIEQTERQKYPDYELSISDDDFSDSEGETSLLAGRERHGKIMNEEDSSLLQILDSWYSAKEGDDRKNELENVDGMIDCSTNGLKPSGSSAIGAGGETCTRNSVRKQKPERKISFVADPVEVNKDKLIDGILGSLKKSGESRVQG